MPQKSESSIVTLVGATLPDKGSCRVATSATITVEEILYRVLTLLPSPQEPPQEVLSKRRDDSSCRTRSVSFSPHIEVYPVLHRRDMSDDEIRRAWISRYERRQIRNALQSTIVLMKTEVGNHLSDDDCFCSRGLEHFCQQSSKASGYEGEVRKSQKIALAMQRVLRRVGATNPDMIAKAYRHYTLKSRSVAYRKALDDQAASAIERLPCIQRSKSFDRECSLGHTEDSSRPMLL
jgi:hypothetical protein